MKPGRKAQVFLAALTGATALAIAFDLIPWLRGPAPYPPEWQWEYREAPPAGRFLAPVACAGGLLALLFASSLRAARLRPRGSARLVIAGSVLLGWAFEISVLNPEPEGALRTLVQRTLSRTDTSYHTVASSPLAEDPLAFLDHHAQLLPELRHMGKHAATHPPGPVLYYRGLIALCESWPRLTETLLGTAGLPSLEREPSRHRDAARASALLGGLLILLFSAATAVPVAALARMAGGDHLASARVAVLWNLLPGPALMSPQFDQALAFLVAAAAATAASAIVGRPGIRPLAAAASGVLAGLALYTSYGAVAFLPTVLFPFLALVGWERAFFRQVAPTAILALAGALGVIGLAVALGHEPFQAARTALAIHREMFTLPRRYAVWLLFNPLDCALFLGVPVATLALLRLGRSASACFSRRSSPMDRGRVVMGLLFLLLVASGTARGEVGRIWIPLMPVMLVMATLVPQTDGKAHGPVSGEALLLGALLALHCLVIRAFWVVP